MYKFFCVMKMKNVVDERGSTFYFDNKNFYISIYLCARTNSHKAFRVNTEIESETGWFQSPLILYTINQISGLSTYSLLEDGDIYICISVVHI